MVEMQIVSCKKCKKDYFIGLDGVDMRNAKISGGSFEGVPYTAIGGDEINKAPKLNEDEIPCPKCGEICKVQSLKSSNANEVASE